MRTGFWIALAVLVVGVLENVLFGSDAPGTAHDISIAFFLAQLIAAVALLVMLVLAVAGRMRRRASAVTD